MGEAAAKLRIWASSPGVGFPDKSFILFPALPGAGAAWTELKRSSGFCSHSLPIYALALCNFPKADGQLGSLRQESGPGRLIYSSLLLACEKRPKAERGGTPYRKYTHATQTQLMPDFQALTLLIWWLCYCMSDERVPKDGQTNYSGKKRGNKQSCKSIKNKTLKQLNCKKTSPVPPKPLTGSRV